MRLDDDDFALFALARRQRQDAVAIDARRRELQVLAHPDRHAGGGAAARRAAMQWSARINEAHRRLRDPLERARLLAALAGQPVDLERPAPMSGEFLARQMRLREAIDDAAGAAALRAIDAELAAAEAGDLDALEAAIDRDADFAAAADRLRSLMFARRLRDDLRRRIGAADEAAEAAQAGENAAAVQRPG